MGYDVISANTRTNAALRHTLEIVMAVGYSIEQPQKGVSGIPQFILVDDRGSAQAEDLEVATEEEPQKREQIL